MFKVGQTVEWTSQAAGGWKTKRGEVVLVVKPGVDAIYKIMGGLENVARNQIKFDTRISAKERIIVKVPRGGKSVLADFYCPNLSKVKVVE